MKLAVSTYSLGRWRSENKKTLEDSFDWIAEQGIGAVEVCGLDEKGAKDPIGRALELRKHAEKCGLAIPSYCVGAEFLMPPDKQAEQIARTKAEIDVAAALGCKSMRHDVTRGFGDNAKGVNLKPTFANALKVVAPAVRELAEYGKSKGVRTTVENHGFFMQASERVEKLVKAVGHKNFGVTMDMGNFLCVNENPVKAVQRIAKYAFMCHVKDFHVKPKAIRPAWGWFDTPTEISLRGAIVGHGAVDVISELKILKKAGYKWYLSLEFEGVEEPANAVKQGLEFLKTHLKAIGAYQE